MRLTPYICPTCGGPAEGTLESVPCLALLNFDEDGNAEYVGETTLDWDHKKTNADAYGRVTLECAHGHQWQAVVSEDFEGEGRKVPQTTETTKHVTTVTVIDPDTGLPCDVEIRKTESGALVGLDAAYLEDIGGSNDQPWSPYEKGVQLIVPEDEGI